MRRTRYLVQDLPQEVQRQRAITVTETMRGGLRWILTTTAIDNREATEKSKDFVAECLSRKFARERLGFEERDAHIANRLKAGH